MSKCDCGSRSAAALFAACTSRSPRPTSSTKLPERRELRAEVVVTRLVRGREVGHQADHVRARRQPQRQLDGLWCRAGPCRCRASRARAERRRPPPRSTPPRRRRPRWRCAARRGESTHHEQPALDARPSQFGGLVSGGDREPLRTARERRVGGQDRAVAVAVRLDDRAQGPRAAARSCARWRRRRCVRPPARRRSRRQGAEHVQACDDAHQTPVLDDRQPVVAGLVDEPGGLACTLVSGPTVSGSRVIMSAALAANALRSRPSKRLSGSRKTVPPNRFM